MVGVGRKRGRRELQWPLCADHKKIRKRTILFAATALFTASVLAQTGFGQRKLPTDAAGACAALSNQDTTKPAAPLARAEINVEEKGDEFLISRLVRGRGGRRSDHHPFVRADADDLGAVFRADCECDTPSVDLSDFGLARDAPSGRSR